VFTVQKELTEINHKDSVIAKWFRHVITAVFAVKCAGTAEELHLKRILSGGAYAGCIRRQLGAGIALVD
jgi:hypothetical protein